MKNYFKFNLKGEKLLPIWLLYLVFVIVPYVFIQFKSNEINHQPHLPGEALQRMTTQFEFLGAMLLIFIIRYGLTFFIAKMSIESTEYKSRTFEFNGRFGEFAGMFLLGLFLSIITIGIYSPWFIKKMYNFFAKNSSHESNSLEFLGKGSNLFIIITLFIIAIVILMSAFFATLVGSASHTTGVSSTSVLMFCVICVIVLPYIYYVYRWTVNFKFKGYFIYWETNFWESIGKIALEVLLSVITLGIYSPLASLKLYKYFAERTVAQSDESNKQFGYDIEPLDDFLFIWGQLLLSLITLGVYYSWASCKISERVLSKTYCEDIEVAAE
jgi:uncharacterized membrane protein YjgN (DUF898 family)